MKINIYIFFFVLLMLCEKFLPSYKVNFFLQFLSLIFILKNLKISISKRFLNILTPLLFAFFIGFIGFVINKNDLSGAIKDVTYFLKPILVLLTSYFIVSRLKNQTVFYKIIVLFAIFTAIIHVLGILITGGILKSIHNIRGDFGLDNFIEVFALYILLFYEKYATQRLFRNKKLTVFFITLFLLSVFLYFSRTMIVILFLVGISILGYFKFTKKALLILTMLLMLTSLFYVYLNNVNLDRNSKGIESFLYKIKIAPEEIFETKIDRENHKDLWDHWRGYEAKRAFALMNEDKKSYLIGTGYGSWVNLKFQSPLGGEKETMKFISRLHNGYVFVLYKLGLVGLLFYIFFLSKLYFYTYSNENVFNNRLISAIGVFYFFTSIVITGIYIPNDLIMFLLGGCIYFSTNQFNLRIHKF